MVFFVIIANLISPVALLVGSHDRKTIVENVYHVIRNKYLLEFIAKEQADDFNVLYQISKHENLSEYKSNPTIQPFRY
jgi:hypothetical protein